MLRTLTLTVLFAVAAWAAAPGEEELRQAEKGWAAAVQKGDWAALERMLGERLIYNHSTGVVEDKQQYLGRLRKGLQKYELIEHASMEVRAYGDAGVVSARVRMKGRSDQRWFDDRLIMLHVWVKQGGRWQLVAHQTTKLP
jgi:ketosteroid isomerase-like protein